MNMDLDNRCNDKTRAGASHFLGVMRNFRFIVSLIFTKNLLDRCEPATLALQSPAMDILAGLETISVLHSVSQELRDNVDGIHAKWYEKALSLAKEVGIDEWKPRNASIQTNRNNVPAKTTSEYYKRSITIPLFDRFVNDMNSRFGDDAITAYQGLAILPCRIVSKNSFKAKLSWQEQFHAFANAYQSDLPNLTV
jgi:hypothetical protein